MGILFISIDHDVENFKYAFILFYETEIELPLQTVYIDGMAGN